MVECRVPIRAISIAHALRRLARSNLVRPRLLLCVALAAAAMPKIAPAQTAVIPYAAEEFEHNSNVFYLPSNGPIPVGNGGATLADNDLRTLAGVDATYDWNRQVFHATGEARRFDYDHFSYLDHNEGLLDGGMDWKLGSVLDGVVDYRHERRMVPFQELIDSTQLFLETENIATASANVQLMPDWRLESLAKARTLDSPRPGLLDLSLREDSIHEGLRYLGVANLSAGFELEYLSGRFTHDPTAETPRYHQTTAQFAANYAVSGLTSFKGALGYTRRSDEVGDNVSGITGSLGYQRNLSGKTTLNLNASRAVNSYVSTAGSEVDTSAGAALTWRITYKTSLMAGYTWTESKFPQLLVVNGVSENNRVDHFQYANLEMDYQVLHWLSVRAYTHYQTRHSNLEGFSFDSTIYGIEFQARLPKRK